MPEDQNGEELEPAIIPASPLEIEAVKCLWSEYWDSLGLPADFQDFEQERRSLPGVYAPPRGRLLIAMVQGNPAGTVAFRPLNERVNERACEAKRLYVRLQYRGHGLGRALLDRLIQEARAESYQAMYGHSLTSMKAALELYRQTGFSEVAAYYSSPGPEAIFWKLGLESGGFH